MSRKLLVGNLPIEASESKIREFLSTYGLVVSIKIRKNTSGRPLGFAEVEMSSPDEAGRLASSIDNAIFEDRQLSVNFVDEAKKKRNSNFVSSWFKFFSKN